MFGWLEVNNSNFNHAKFTALNLQPKPNSI
jgi:hypothetical protein